EGGVVGFLSAIICDTQLRALPPLMVDVLLPVLPADDCKTSSAAVEGPRGLFDTSYFSVIPVGLLKYLPLPPASNPYKAMTSSLSDAVVMTDVVAVVPRPKLPAEASTGFDVSTPL